MKSLAVLLLSLLCLWPLLESGTVRGEDACFSTSLHATGEGMRYWYEEEGGLMSITGIPYAELDCSSCHVKSCDQCHGEQDEATGACRLTVEKARSAETCLACHGREGLTYRMCEASGTLDVQYMADSYEGAAGEDVSGWILGARVVIEF